VGSSTPHNPVGLQGLLRGQLYFTFYLNGIKNDVISINPSDINIPSMEMVI
jgi:hypothetical protein